MVVVWRGYGWLVPGIVISALLVTQLALDGLFGENTYTSNEWAKFVAFGVMAVGLALAAYVFNFRNRKILVDENTGAESKSKSHTFFWLPIEAWAVLAPVLFAINTYNIAAEQHEFRTLLAAPQVGDVYLVDFSEIYSDFDQTYRYGAFKVGSVVARDVTLLPSNTIYNAMKGPRGDLAKGAVYEPAYFVDRPVYLSTAELLELLEQGAIYSIKR